MGSFRDFAGELRTAFRDAFALPSGAVKSGEKSRGLGIWDTGAVSSQPMGRGSFDQGMGMGVRSDSPWDSASSDAPDSTRLASAANRVSRYAEYDFLDSIPEIWSSLNTYADEASSIDEHGHVLDVQASNSIVKEEIEWLFFTRLNVDDEMTTWARALCKYGDLFGEITINPDDVEDGIQGVKVLPGRSMWRIETTSGHLVEFQQSWSGPDYESVVSKPIAERTDNEEGSSWYAGRVIRFLPAQIVHARINAAGSSFYPYGMSVLAVSRRPAHMLRLMEDAMMVYRITRAPEKRVFYVDIGNMHPHKVEGYLQKIKDKLKKKSIYNPKTGTVDERYSPWAVDEDFFLPTRNGVGTKVESLPGGANLGENDDVVYFKNKLSIALRVPKGYFERDINADSSRFSLSSRDIEFAKTIHRIQKVLARMMKEIATRHLRLIGIPEEQFEDLNIVITPPSQWLEIMHAEVLDARLNRANSALQSQLMSRFDIYTQLLSYSDDEAAQMIRRYHEEMLQEARIAAFSDALKARATAAADSVPNLPQPLIPPSLRGEKAEELREEPPLEAPEEAEEKFLLPADEEDAEDVPFQTLGPSSPREVATILGLADRLS